MKEYDIGARLKKERLRKGMTLKDVAERAGCSIALVSQVENNNITPSIARLSRFSKILGLKLSSLFEPESRDGYEIVRKGRKRFSGLVPIRNKKGADFHVPYLRKFSDGKMVPYLINLSGDVSDSMTLSREGESFIYVMKGRFELFLDSRSIVLGEGDSVYFDTSIPHRYCCEKGSETTIFELRAFF